MFGLRRVPSLGKLSRPVPQIHRWYPLYLIHVFDSWGNFDTKSAWYFLVWNGRPVPQVWQRPAPPVPQASTGNQGFLHLSMLVRSTTACLVSLVDSVVLHGRLIYHLSLLKEEVQPSYDSQRINRLKETSSDHQDQTQKLLIGNLP